jgi:hypothetical protein
MARFFHAPDSSRCSGRAGANSELRRIMRQPASFLLSCLIVCVAVVCFVDRHSVISRAVAEAAGSRHHHLHKKVFTTTALTSSSAKIAQGTSPTMTATVTSTKPVSGSVTFSGTFSNTGPISLVNGVAQTPINGLPLGTVEIDANYSGDANNLASMASFNQTTTGNTLLFVAAQTIGAVADHREPFTSLCPCAFAKNCYGSTGKSSTRFRRWKAPPVESLQILVPATSGISQ